MKTLTLVLLLLTGCDVPTHQEYAIYYVEHFTYFKDKLGYCYTMIGNREDTLTNIPCDKVIVNEEQKISNPCNAFNSACM